jgi:hypothetical protein
MLVGVFFGLAFGFLEQRGTPRRAEVAFFFGGSTRYAVVWHHLFIAEPDLARWRGRWWWR